MIDLETIRADVAFYAFIILSSIHAGNSDIALSVICLILAPVIWIADKIRRNRSNAAEGYSGEKQ